MFKVPPTASMRWVKDDKRFLIANSDSAANAVPLTIVLNWRAGGEEVALKAPGRIDPPLAFAHCADGPGHPRAPEWSGTEIVDVRCVTSARLRDECAGSVRRLYANSA